MRGFRRVMLVPSSIPPHKAGQADMAPAGDRLSMCRIAASAHEMIEVSDIELRRTGPSYTLDTVRELRSLGHRQIHWLIGADMLAILPTWHRASELIREATILVMARPGAEIDWASLPGEYHFLQQNVVQAPLMDISATEIRRRVRRGEPIDHLVPKGVARYIAAHGLYR